MYIFLKSEQCSDFFRPICTLKSEQPTFRKPPIHHQNPNIVRILKIRMYYWTLPYFRGKAYFRKGAYNPDYTVP